MAEWLVAKREPLSVLCKWRQILSKHTTNRPKGQGRPLQSIASCSQKEQVQEVDGLVRHRFTINAGCAFFPDDGVTWQLTAWAETANEAEEGCCLQGVALLLLLDAANFRLLDKDWLMGARAVAQKGHDMMHAWLRCGADVHADGGHFYGAMTLGDMSDRSTSHLGHLQPNQVTLRYPTAPQAVPNTPPVAGQTLLTSDQDDQIRALVRGFIDRWKSSGREGAVKMNDAPGGKKYGPQLGTLLPAGALREWLGGQDEFEIVDYADGSWGVQYCAGPGSGSSSSTQI
jgi:hypothetical protein